LGCIERAPDSRVTLAQILRGASSQEAPRTLGISPRAVEFYRATILQKLGAPPTSCAERSANGAVT
jgi:FixJ family two-component response regulator